MKFLAEDDRLTITLEGIEVFFGLKRQLVIPRVKIASLEWRPEFAFEGRIWRTGGAGIPGVLYAGHFRGNGKRYFLYLHAPKGVSWVNGPVSTQNTLVITTQGYPYQQILLSCRPDVGMGLVNWWQGATAASLSST